MVRGEERYVSNIVYISKTYYSPDKTRNEFYVGDLSVDFGAGTNQIINK